MTNTLHYSQNYTKPINCEHSNCRIKDTETNSMNKQQQEQYNTQECGSKGKELLTLNLKCAQFFRMLYQHRYIESTSIQYYNDPTRATWTVKHGIILIAVTVLSQQKPTCLRTTAFHATAIAVLIWILYRENSYKFFYLLEWHLAFCNI